MSGQCWANVVDGGPTLVKHWVDVSCLLGGIVVDVGLREPNGGFNLGPSFMT